jgi:hypothetical protein
MLDEVNFHSRPRWNAWSEYMVLALALVAAIALLAGAQFPTMG